MSFFSRQLSARYFGAVAKNQTGEKMDHDFEILRTREDVINRIFDMVGIVRTDAQSYLNRDECVQLLAAIRELKKK